MFSKKDTGMPCAWATSSTLRGAPCPLPAVKQFKDHSVSFGHVLGLFALLSVGFILGTAGISAAERRLRSRSAGPAPVAGGEAAAVLRSQDVARSQAGAEEARRRALQTGMVIATAIGLHNFAEGLAVRGS